MRTSLKQILHKAVINAFNFTLWQVTGYRTQKEKVIRHSEICMYVDTTLWASLNKKLK